MALVPFDRYPSQTGIDPNYPHGKARNASSFQDGTGTPLEADWVNDLWGFLQALLAAGREWPDGEPDAANASQYLAALRTVASETTSGRHLRAAMTARQLNLNGTTPGGGDYLAAIGEGASGQALVVKGGANGVFKIADTSLAHMIGVTAATLGDVRAIAFNGTNRYVAVGNPSNAYSASGNTWTAGGSMGGLGIPWFVVWSGSEFIAADLVGKTRHSTNAVAWSAPVGADFDAVASNGVRGLARLSPGVVLGIAPGGVVCKTLDHGASWSLAAPVPTTIDNPSMTDIVGDGSGEVLAFVKDGFGTLVECWASVDGDNWALRSQHDGHSSESTTFRALMCQDTGLVVVASAEDPACVTASADRGRSWSPPAFYFNIAGSSIAVARGRIFCGAGDRIFATDRLA